MQHRVVNFRQVRSFDQVLSTTFTFLRVVFKPLMKSLFIIVGPFTLLAGIMYGLFFNNIVQFNSYGGEPDSGAIVSFAVTISLFFVFLLLAVVLLITSLYAFIVLYVESGGVAPTVEEVWRRTRSSLLRMAGTGIVAGILTGLAFMFFFLPGMYIGTVLSLIFIMRMQEPIGLGDAINRCFRLIQNHWWQTFGILFLLSTIAAIIGYVFAVPQLILMTVYQLTLLEGEGTTVLALLMIVFTSLTMIANMLLYTVTYTGIAVQYYSLVERKEAAGLREKVEGMEQLASSEGAV